MGASFTVMLFLPILLVGAFIMNIFGFVTGADQTKIALPYDPDKGLVWEYDNKNDPYIKLHDTVIEGDEQIFCFRDKHGTTNSENGEWMDVIFTDKNGNQLKYYLSFDHEGVLEDEHQDFLVLAPGEYHEYEYTVKADNAKIGGDWYITYLDRYRTNLDIAYMPWQEKKSEETFKLVFAKPAEGESYKSKLLFSYGMLHSIPFEELVSEFEITADAVTLIGEERTEISYEES